MKLRVAFAISCYQVYWTELADVQGRARQESQASSPSSLSIRSSDAEIQFMRAVLYC